MSDDLDLARRAVACRAWRWLPGMQWSLPGTSLGGRYRGMILDPEAIPDLTDPATLRGLLALVREAHGDVVWLHSDSGVWTARKTPENPGGSVAEVEALVVALEGAP